MSDADEVMQALAAGIGRRTTLRGPQGQRRSSRCHMVFTVNLMQRRLIADGRSASQHSQSSRPGRAQSPRLGTTP